MQILRKTDRHHLRLCTKSRRAKVRRGKNRRGTAGVAFDSTCCRCIPSLFLTKHHRAQPTFRTEPKSVGCSIAPRTPTSA
ncbi:hypothetical protein B7R56_20165 [Pseudomonas savastanoi pv. retacarpa]|nr:hypothetical protein B7R56_20165 [Pseudomonas savastanoi pv. retacarpa]